MREEEGNDALEDFDMRMTHSGGWTHDRVGALKKLWLEGQSASQVAKQLGGGVTRNAVIAKVHRLGLSRGSGPSMPARVALSSRPPAVRERSTAQPVAPPAPPRQVMLGTVIISTLGAHMCKWPIGDPMTTEFSFCGRSTDSIYCVEHAKVAYQPPTKRTTNYGAYDRYI